MKRTILLLLALSLSLLLVSCSNNEPVGEEREVLDLPKETTPQEESSESPDPIVKSSESSASTTDAQQPENAQETESASESEEESEITHFLDPEFEALKEKTSRVSSYSYYHLTTGNTQGDNFNIMGDRIRVDKYNYNAYEKETNIDTIYIDRANEEAVGYCEDQSKIRCENPNKPFSLLFREVNPKTPLEWLDAPLSAKVTGSEKIEGRTVIVAIFSTEKQDGVMYVDEFYGIPMRIDITLSEENFFRHRFSDMKFNHLSEDEMVHQYVPKTD